MRRIVREVKTPKQINWDSFFAECRQGLEIRDPRKALLAYSETYGPKPSDCEIHFINLDIYDLSPENLIALPPHLITWVWENFDTDSAPGRNELLTLYRQHRRSTPKPSKGQKKKGKVGETRFAHKSKRLKYQQKVEENLAQQAGVDQKRKSRWRRVKRLEVNSDNESVLQNLRKWERDRDPEV